MSTSATESWTMSAWGEDTAVKVSARVQRVGDELSIQYEIAGKGGEPLLVLDALHRFDSHSEMIYDHELAFTGFEEPATLVVKRCVPVLPRLADIYMAYLPWGRRLEPGGVLAGDIRFKLPVAEHSPYYPPTARSVYRSAAATHLRLVLAYAPLTATMEIAPVPETSDLFEVERTGTGIQTINVGIDLGHSIAVRRRSDRFEPA